MGQRFSVIASKLGAGSQDITGFLDRCEAVASDATRAILAMGGAAGHAGLAAALDSAAEQGSRTFLDLGSAYQHVAAGLTTTAATYSHTEQDLVARAGQIRRGSP